MRESLRRCAEAVQGWRRQRKRASSPLASTWGWVRMESATKWDDQLEFEDSGFKQMPVAAFISGSDLDMQFLGFAGRPRNLDQNGVNGVGSERLP